MKHMKCIVEHKGCGFLRNNNDKKKNIHIKVGDIIEVDNYGYLWFKDVCFGHINAYVGECFEPYNG